MNRIGIIGVRSRNSITDYNIVKEAFFKIYKEGDWIVSGHAYKGGDAFAEKISFDYGIPILLFPPKKKTAKEFFARNTLIAKFSNVIIACVVNPEDGAENVLKRKSGGTEDTLKKFRKFYSEGEILIV